VVLRSLYQGVGSLHTKISTRHGQISDATREKVTAKVEKLVRYFDRITAILVTIDLKDRDAPSVDLKVSAKHKHDFVATGQADELMASIDAATGKLEQQLRKHKEKIQDRHRGSGHRQQEIPSDSE